jgi:hypothetical protein
MGFYFNKKIKRIQKKHEINLCKAICKCFFHKNEKINFFKKSKEYLIERLSIENILRSIINLDLLKILFFDLRDFKEFTNIPKLDLDKLNKIFKVNMKEDYDIDENEIDKYKDKDNLKYLYENRFINYVDDFDN